MLVHFAVIEPIVAASNSHLKWTPLNCPPMQLPSCFYSVCQKRSPTSSSMGCMVEYKSLVLLP